VHITEIFTIKLVNSSPPRRFGISSCCSERGNLPHSKVQVWGGQVWDQLVHNQGCRKPCWCEVRVRIKVLWCEKYQDVFDFNDETIKYKIISIINCGNS
jgi:hypothetical protein